MAITFLGITQPPLVNVSAVAPDGAIIGIIGLKGSGKTALLRIAAGLESPQSGAVQAGPKRRLIRLGEPLEFPAVDLLALDAALSCQDALFRGQASVRLERLRRNGTTILFASHDEALLMRLCDEIWWLDGGTLRAKGDVRDVLPKYRDFVARRLVEWGRDSAEPIDFTSRRGDGRADIVSLETIDQTGAASSILRSHQPAEVRVLVRFRERVDHPVIGIMVRTRIGLEVYGTNTELENVPFGPCEAGTEVKISFGLTCDLCPGDYTLTAASHDRDGTAHDWLDDAIEFRVTDDRYTAGVANLRAEVTVERSR
jgi:lipopolysaccharide transport system ATP-binding protein